MTVISLLSRTQQEFALQQLSKTPLGEGYECVIRAADNKRSVAQNALYWKWMTEIARHMHDTKDGIHFYCKREFLLPILVRDDDQFGEMWATVTQTKMKTIESGVVKLLSTTALSVKQYTEYLNEIEQFYRSNGVRFSHPEDLYRRAMIG